MRTLREFEESDIDLSDKLHSVISLAIPLLSLSYTKETMGANNEKLDNLSKKIVASFLNMIEGSGYTIIKKDDSIPKAFDY